jgi:hypothetical protein
MLCYVCVVLLPAGPSWQHWWQHPAQQQTAAAAAGRCLCWALSTGTLGGWPSCSHTSTAARQWAWRRRGETLFLGWIWQQLALLLAKAGCNLAGAAWRHQRHAAGRGLSACQLVPAPHTQCIHCCYDTYHVGTLCPCWRGLGSPSTCCRTFPPAPSS